MSTREFEHYDGCQGDVENCGACALTNQRQDSPNYAAWPLSYMSNRRTIPAKWFDAFCRELQSNNRAYVDNIRKHIAEYGVRFG
jgi:hypothetical protein